jgi:hypothetical protein
MERGKLNADSSKWLGALKFVLHSLKKQIRDDLIIQLAG